MQTSFSWTEYPDTFHVIVVVAVSPTLLAVMSFAAVTFRMTSPPFTLSIRKCPIFGTPAVSCQLHLTSSLVVVKVNTIGPGKQIWTWQQIRNGGQRTGEQKRSKRQKLEQKFCFSSLFHFGVCASAILHLLVADLQKVAPARMLNMRPERGAQDGGAQERVATMSGVLGYTQTPPPPPMVPVVVRGYPALSTPSFVAPDFVSSSMPIYGRPVAGNPLATMDPQYGDWQSISMRPLPQVILLWLIWWVFSWSFLLIKFLSLHPFIYSTCLPEILKIQEWTTER